MSTQPKILYVIGQLGRGGAEQQLYYLLSEIPFRTTVLSMSSGGYWAEPIRELGQDVIELKRTGRMEFHRLLSVIKVIRNVQPDVIHIFLDGVSALYSRIAAMFFSKLIVVVGERSLPIHYPKWYRLILPILNKRVSCVVCNSRKAITYYKTNRLIPEECLYYIPNSVKIDMDLPVEDSSGLPHTTIIGTVGSLTRPKNPLLFLEMAARVHSFVPNTEFWMVGDGSLRDVCESRAVELKIDSVVKFWGRREDVPELFLKMDLFCLSSRYEGTPNALLEAMLAGLPCVVTDAGDSGMIVKEAESGIVIDNDDVEDYATSVIKLLNDSSMRERMGQSGLEYIKSNHTPAEMTRKYFELYGKMDANICSAV